VSPQYFRVAKSPNCPIALTKGEAVAKITRAEVEHVARLARLELSEEELARYREQLSAILDYAARLQAVDTSWVALAAEILTAEAPLRADEPAVGLAVDKLLRGAPQVEENQFRVPPVLE